MDNDFINDFIEEYKNQPCLWQASSTDFKDRKKRQQAYYKLIEVASKHGEHYNIERTKQKINNLRCAFRHQLKKFTESKSSGKSGKDEGYCPKRRYIESLMFLLNEEQPENAKVDNLKTATIMPVTKKKANGISKNLNNSNSITNNSKKLLVTNNNKQQQQQKRQQQQQVYCEAIVIPGDSQSNAVDDVMNNEKQNKRHLHHQQSQQQQHQQQQPQPPIQEVVVKSIEEIRPDTITTQQEDSVSQQQDPLQIEVHCNDDVKLIWPKSNITSQNPNESSVPIPITSSTPITISNVPISGVSLISAPIPTSVPTTTTAAITINNDNNNHSNNDNYNNSRINNTNNSNNASNHQVNISSTTRQRTMSTSSQNSSHSIIENAPKKIKIDCSATNFEKLLSLACSKINSINDADDDFTIFGKMVSYKLRSMDPQQAIIAEKMITDILLEGQMKMLAYPTRTTTITSYRHDEG